MVETADQPTSLEDHIPPGWQRGPDLDLEIVAKIRAEVIPIQPIDSTQTDTATLNWERTLGKFPTAIRLIIRDDSMLDGYVIEAVRPEDLEKGPRELLIEETDRMFVNHNWQEVELLQSAYLVVTGRRNHLSTVTPEGSDNTPS